MVLQSDREELHALIRETLMLLCQKGLSYKSEVCLEALIGITLDQENVLLINIKELINAKRNSTDIPGSEPEVSDNGGTPKTKTRRRKRKRSAIKDDDSDGDKSFDDAEQFAASTPILSATSTNKDTSLEDEMENKFSNTNRDTLLENNIENTFGNDDVQDEESYAAQDTENSILQHEESSESAEKSFVQYDESYAVESTEYSFQETGLQSPSDMSQDHNVNQELSVSVKGETSTSAAVYIDIPTEMTIEIFPDGEMREATESPVHRASPRTPKMKGTQRTPRSRATKTTPKKSTPRSRTKKDAAKHIACELCGREVISSYMKQHLNLHRGIYLYNCDQCGKGFMSKSSIDGHMSTHTGVKKYSCPVCKQLFKHKQSQVLHLKKVHGNMME